MDPNEPKLHMFFFPFMAHGHIIPMIDTARLFTARGVMASIITTPLNASRFQSIIDRSNAPDSAIRIQFFLLEFPCSEAGLPANCENYDQVPSPELFGNFIKATKMLQQPFEELVQSQLPNAIVYDYCFPWMTKVAGKFRIPILKFHVTNCFTLIVAHALRRGGPHKSIESNDELFVVNGIPDQIELTKAKLPKATMAFGDAFEFLEEIQESHNLSCYGVIINSFEELEKAYVEHYKKVIGNTAWLIGPVSLCNKDHRDMIERGKKASIDHEWCLRWLDSKEPNSVIYVCFGSAYNISKLQLVQLGLGLEASGVTFIWVIRRGDVDEWLPCDFEERVKGRGVVIRGWAPQILILSHCAIGGFLTHCGWNSMLECISAGLPMITWPLFGDHFYNEKLVVQVWKIGIGIGVEVGISWGEEEKIGVLVWKEEIEKTVRRFMGGEEENEEMRKRAKKFGDMARRSVEEGGSSYLNVGNLIQVLMEEKGMKKENYLS